MESECEQDFLTTSIFDIFILKVRDMIDKIDRDTAAENNIVGQRKLSYGEFEHVRLINSSISNTKGTVN